MARDVSTPRNLIEEVKREVQLSQSPCPISNHPQNRHYNRRVKVEQEQAAAFVMAKDQDLAPSRAYGIHE